MNRLLIFSIIFCHCSYGQTSSSQIYQHGNGDATIQNSDGSSSQIYQYGNGDATIQNSDGSSSQVYEWGNGDKTIINSDGSSSQVYEWGNGDQTIQHSDGSSSQIYQYGNGDATIQHSDGSSSQIYQYGNGDATIQHSGGSFSQVDDRDNTNNTIQNNQSLNFNGNESQVQGNNSLKPGEFYKISSQVNNSNQNSTNTDVHGISDEAYDAIGDAAGQLAAILLIRRAEKKHKKFTEEYLKKPSIESAFEIEKHGSRAINLTKNTAKMISSASNNQNYESNFSGSTSIDDKWGPVSEEHKTIVEKFGSYRKYKKSLK